MNKQSSETLVPNNPGAGTAKARVGDNVIGITLKERYLVEKEIGKGGFGAVYLARDLELLSKPVVVKLLHQASLQNDWAVRKFQHEIEALARIDHPGVVGVLATGSMPNGDPFIVMEYVEGTSLRSVMEKTPEGMDLHRTADIIQQIGHALTAAHEKGIIHRDLKPENVMIRSLGAGDEQVKIIDFGIAKVKDSRLAPSTVMGLTAGTIVYMAPEQLTGQSVSASSDTYSLGAIAYEMLTGRRPFNPATLFQLAEIQRDGVKIKPSDLRPSIPAVVDDVVVRALSYDPANRYPSAGAFADSFAKALESELTDQLLPNAPTIPMPRVRIVLERKKRYRQIAAGILLLAVLVAGVLVWTRTRSRTATNQPANEAVKPSATIRRTLDYYLMVQKHLPNGQPYQQPFKATGNDTLGDGWKFTIHTSSQQEGFLYIVNEGPAAGLGTAYNLLYPSPKYNDGSAKVEAAQDRGVGPYELDKQQGTEKIWLVWSASPVAQLEAVKSVVNPKEQGIVSDPQRAEDIRNFFLTQWASKPEVDIDKGNKVVHVRTTSDVLVNLIEIEHH